MCSFRLILVGLLAGAALSAQEAVRSEPIDLVTVLRLAGAESLDVKLAEARVSEARATADSATWAQPVLDGRRVFIKDESHLTLWLVE